MHSLVYQVLRNEKAEKAQAFTSTKDVFYGAFKLGVASANEELIDSNVLMLTAKFVVVLDTNLKAVHILLTEKLVKPTRMEPNPVLTGQNLQLRTTGGQQLESLVFSDEYMAKAACAMFADMFYNLNGQSTSQND